MFKQLMKRAGALISRWSVVVKNLMGATLILALCSCASTPRDNGGSTSFKGGGNNAVYVVGYQRHSGIVIPTNKVLAKMPELTAGFGASSVIEFGWGEAKLYRGQTNNSLYKLAALMVATPSVIKLSTLPDDFASLFPDEVIGRLCLSDSELDDLVNYVVDSFKRDADGNVIFSQSEELKTDLASYHNEFYESKGGYSISNTCNTWTENALSSFGMKVAKNPISIAGIRSGVAKHGQLIESTGSSTGNVLYCSP